MAKNDNYQERSKSTVTLKPLAHKAIKRRSTRVKSIAQYRRQHFAGMSDALSFKTKPIDIKPIDAVKAHKIDIRPESHLAGHSDMLAKASDEKTKAVNLAVRLRRVPVAIQLNTLLAHKQKLISQCEAAYRVRKLKRCNNLIKQLEMNEAKIKALVLELQDNGVDFASLNSAFSDVLKTL